MNVRHVAQTARDGTRIAASGFSLLLMEEDQMRGKPILLSMLAAVSLAACASDPGASASAGASADARAPSFQRLDADGDGFVSLAESKADGRVSRDFLRADTNADWRLNRQEFDSAFAR